MTALQAIRIQVPIGIPTSDGGLEIPNRIFLGGIPTETTELELELFFSDYGNVRDVRIVTDRVTGHCKGYGFVTFELTDDIQELLGQKTILMKGKKLRIRRAIRRNGSQFQSLPVDESLLSRSGTKVAPFRATDKRSGVAPSSQGPLSYPPPSNGIQFPPYVMCPRAEPQCNQWPLMSYNGGVLSAAPRYFSHQYNGAANGYQWLRSDLPPSPVSVYPAQSIPFPCSLQAAHQISF